MIRPTTEKGPVVEAYKKTRELFQPEFTRELDELLEWVNGYYRSMGDVVGPLKGKMHEIRAKYEGEK